MSIFTGLYTLNSQDLYDYYGCYIPDKPSDFITMPKRKDSVNNDYADVNGLAIDLSAVYYSARQIKVTLVMRASSLSDYQTKYTRLFTAFLTSGTIPLYCSATNRTYNIYYIENTGVTRYTPMNVNPIVISFDITFNEPVPNIT